MKRSPDTSSHHACPADRTDIGSESPFFFPNEGRMLFGILHRAVVPSNGRGVVMCYPFAEERLWAHRVMVRFARTLADRGYSVLRFDYGGNGDSEGRFEDSTVATNLSDIAAALRRMVEELPDVHGTDLLGLRFGATLAAMAAAGEGFAGRLILWEPVLSGHHYAQELLRVNLVTQTAVYNRILHDRKRLVEMMEAGEDVNVDGYGLTRAMFRQMTAIDLEKTDIGNSCPALIVQIDDKPKEMRAGYLRFASRFGNARLAAVVEDPFWKEIKTFYGQAPDLSAATLEFMEKA